MSIYDESYIFVMMQTEAAANFTVSKSSEAVDLNIPSLITSRDNTGLMIDAFDGWNFPNGCNLELLSVGYRLPFGFEFEKFSDSARIYSKISYGIVTEAAPLNRVEIGRLNLPLDNYEMSFPLYRSVQANLGHITEKFSLWATFPTDVKPKILMLNVPDYFDGKTYYVPIFLKVQAKYKPGLI